MPNPPQAAPSPPTKKRKPNTQQTPLDIPATLNLKPGSRLQVKWTIQDDDEDPPPETAQQNDAADSKSTTVWWSATLKPRMHETHTVTDEEEKEVDMDNSVKIVSVYELDYDPLPEMGFEERALERVAFLSNKALLNINSKEIMIYKREGEDSPPPSDDEDESGEVRHLNADGIASLMDDIMKRSLETTGMNAKLKSLPMDQRQAFAEKVKGVKDALYERLMGEMERVGGMGGEKVITGDVVRKCVGELNQG